MDGEALVSVVTTFRTSAEGELAGEIADPRMHWDGRRSDGTAEPTPKASQHHPHRTAY